jgi:hypothetical protein
MDIDNLKEILLSISTEEKQALIQSVQLIEEIQSSIVVFFLQLHVLFIVLFI